MKYKVGDKVRVKSDLVVEGDYGADCFVSGMEPSKGTVVTIRAIYGKTYDVHESKYYFTDEMLEPIEDKQP